MGIQLPTLLSDGMVLQRGAKITLWGTADAPFALNFLGKSHDVTPGADGRWAVPLNDFVPGGPYEMQIGDRALRNVYIGDVWLCAGQSNMQLPMRRFRRGAQVSPPEPETFAQRKPTGFFNGMIAPLRRVAARGCLWYQGESDAGQPSRYAEKFAAMASDWRRLFGAELPFLTVELAQWDEGAWDALRAEQWRALQRVPQVAMAAAYDLGEDNDLHPQGKQPVGDRLARCAMRLAYGEELPASPFEIIPLRQQEEAL